MLISKLKNSKLKLLCTGPGPTNTRDEVVVTEEYLGCIRTQVTLDSSHHINHRAHYSVSFTIPTASISSRELELRCHVSQISAQCVFVVSLFIDSVSELFLPIVDTSHWPRPLTRDM